MRKPSQSTRKSYSLSLSQQRKGLMKRCSSFSFLTSRASSSCFPFMGFSLAASEASSNSNKLTFHSINNKVSFLSVPETSTIDHVHFIKDFCSLIRNLSINSKDYGALRSLDSLLTKTHVLDSATSVVVIDGLCSLNKLTRAITVLSNVRKKGNVSDYFLYSLVFHRMVREGRIDGVEFVWNEVFGSESSSLNGTIDASGYVIYICKFGNLLEIESVCKRVLVSAGVLKQQSYIALVGALCREKRTLLVKQVLLKMKSMGYEPDDITYFTVFQCFCRSGKLAEADLILRELFRRKYNMDICIFGNFMYGLCKRGMLKEADKLFRKLVKNERLSSRLSGVVHLKEKRRAIFQLNCHGLVPEIMAYESYFKSLCSVGRLDEAKPLLKEMMRKRTVVEVCVYRSFIKALFRAGRSEDAIRFFNVQRTKGLVPVEEMAGSLISGLCQMGNVDDAWRIFSEINMNESFVSATNICNCILDCYWKLGRLVEAVNLFERMQHGSFGGPNISTYMVMVNGFCDEGKFFEALSIFEEMLKNNMSMNGTLYEVIIRGLCLSRKLEEAHKYLNKMVEDGQLVSYVRWKLIFDSMFVSSEAGLSFESNQCK